MRDAKGRFLPRPDRQRHTFTPAERRKGGQTTWRRAMNDEPWLLRWLQKRIDATAATRPRRTG